MGDNRSSRITLQKDVSLAPLISLSIDRWLGLNDGAQSDFWLSRSLVFPRRPGPIATLGKLVWGDGEVRDYRRAGWEMQL
jgi:hypothetical protein